MSMISKKTTSNTKYALIGILVLTFLFFVSFFPGIGLLYYNRQYFYFLVILYAIVTYDGKISGKLFSGEKPLILFSLLVTVVSMVNHIRMTDVIAPLYFIVSCIFAKMIVGKNPGDTDKNLSMLVKLVEKMYVCIAFLYLGITLLGKRNSAWVYAAYIFPAMLPFIFWGQKEERKKWYVFVLGFIAVLLTMKRGPLLCMFAVPVVYLISIILSKKYSLNKRFKFFFVLALGTFAVVLLGITMIQSDQMNTFIRLLDIKNELEHSRGPLFKATIEAFMDSDTIFKLFGHGFNSVVADELIPTTGSLLSSHNDFIEILYNAGIVGILLYVIFLVNVFIAAIKLCRANDKWGFMMLAALCTFLTQSNVSHLYLYNYIFHFWIVLWVCGILKAKKLKSVATYNYGCLNRQYSIVNYRY